MPEKIKITEVTLNASSVREINGAKWEEDEDHPDGGEWVTVPDVHVELQARFEGTKIRLTIDTDSDDAPKMFTAGKDYVVEISEASAPEPKQPS